MTLNLKTGFCEAKRADFEEIVLDKLPSFLDIL
jgi:hypothetical protein